MNASISTLHEQQAYDPLADAVLAYIDAKRAEDAATDARVNAERRILALHPAKEEGAESFEAGGFKVTLTGKLNYACDDMAALTKACSAWPANMQPIKTVVQLDATGCKFLRANEPEIWRTLAPFVTVKPAKPAVKVSV